MNGKIERVLPFFRRLNKKRQEELRAYFKNAPDWLIDCFTIEKIEKGRIFIREGNPVDAIYFVCEGTIKATDYRVYGIKFDFMLFTKLYAYGGMEVIMGLDKYRTSLETVSECTVIKIPKSRFEKWLKTDIDALAYESKLMGEYMLEQARNVRAFLFLQGSDRLTMLFTNRYEKYAYKEVLKLNNDRQELSDFTGLSLKTITRSVKKLKEEGLIAKEGRYIVINKEQYHCLKQNLANLLSDDE